MSSSSTDAALVDVPMPQMGVSVAEGTVVAWRKQVGDAIERDETICEISTDKIDSECPSPVAGVLEEILVAEGETVDVGTVLARIASEDGAGGSGGVPPGSVGTVDAGGTPSGPAGTPGAGAISAEAGGQAGSGGIAAEGVGLASQPTTNGHAAADRAPGGAPNGRGPSARGYSPVVRRMADAHGLDLSRVSGTGRGGRVTKRDVLAYIEQGEPEERPMHSDSPYRPDPPPAVEVVDGGRSESLSRMRQSIGAAMRRSQETAATCTTIVECDMSAVERRRRELGITALPIVARATVETLAEFGELNATLDGTTITRYDQVNLGIAVSLGDDGLIVPVIQDAQDLSEQGLAKRVKDLATRARAKQLTADDVQGATFTITNPGAYGAVIATPVINLPQVAILDLEAIVRRPVVITDADGNESIGIRPIVNLCMSWDHRAIDGVYAARFLTALRRRLEG